MVTGADGSDAASIVGKLDVVNVEDAFRADVAIGVDAAGGCIGVDGNCVGVEGD